MKIESEEISDYIKEMIDAIKKGIPKGYGISSPVKFQIGVNNTRESNGFLKLSIAGIGGKRSKEENARIEFEVSAQESIVSKEVKEAMELLLTHSKAMSEQSKSISEISKLTKKS